MVASVGGGGASKGRGRRYASSVVAQAKGWVGGRGDGRRRGDRIEWFSFAEPPFGIKLRVVRNHVARAFPAPLPHTGFAL